MKAVRIGIVGMGWMGEVHSRAYRHISDRFRASGIQPRLVACADEVEARAREGKERFGFERYTTNWQEVVVADDIDALSVTTPNHMHLEIVRSAARAGKHIFCEKPVGRNPRETAEIEREARKAGIYTFTGYNYRWCPLVQHARELIQKGSLGRLTHYRGRFFCCYGSNPDSVLSWRFQKEIAGLGTLADLMSHAVDMALMLAGPIKRVVGSCETFIRERPIPAPGVGTHFTVRKGAPKTAVTNEDYVGSLVEFSNGVRGTLEACRVINGPKCQIAFEANGTQGALSWDFERMNELRFYASSPHAANEGYARILSGPAHPYHVQFNPGAGVGLGYDDLKVIEAFRFLKSILDGHQLDPSFSDALKVAAVLVAIQRSWESERWEPVTDMSLHDNSKA